MGPEHHLTFTKETPYESKYLTHRVLPNIGATGPVHAEQVVDILHEFNSENTIKAILVDNTNANTGCEGGMVAILEKIFLNNFTQLVALCTIMNYLSEPFLKIYMVTQKALQHSVAPWGNYAQRIAMIYPKYHFPLLAVLWIQF